MRAALAFRRPGDAAVDRCRLHRRPAMRRNFAESELVRPEGYDRWPIVGASIGLSYAESMEGSGPGAFHRVYINPSAYETFRRTRSFPDGTTFVLEIREAARMSQSRAVDISRASELPSRRR